MSEYDYDTEKTDEEINEIIDDLLATVNGHPDEFVAAYSGDHDILLEQFIEAAQGAISGYLTPERLVDRMKDIYESALEETIRWEVEQ